MWYKNLICEITHSVVSPERTRWRMPPFRNLAFATNSVVRLAWLLTLRTKPFLEGFVWSLYSITLVISRRHFAPTCWFWQGYIFSFDLSDNLNKTNKFTNFNFCDITLHHSIDCIYNFQLRYKNSKLKPEWSKKLLSGGRRITCIVSANYSWWIGWAC